MDATTAGLTHQPYNDDIVHRIQVTVSSPLSISPASHTHSRLQITLIRSVARYLKYAVILPLALVGCGLAFCMLHMWIGLLYALRCLLLITAALLRECIDLPDLDGLKTCSESVLETASEAVPNTVPDTVPLARAELDKRFMEEMMAKSPRMKTEPQDPGTETLAGHEGGRVRVDSPLGRHERASRWEQEAVWFDQTCDGEPVAPWDITSSCEPLIFEPVASWNVASLYETANGSANGSAL